MSAASPSARRPARLIGLLLLLPLGVVLAGLTACQGRLIYPAPRYGEGVLARLPRGITALPAATGEGAQWSFWRPPRDGRAPERIWVVCGGNGANALGMSQVCARGGARGDGFLFVDYPGYGMNEGSSTPARIQAALDAAVEALAAHLGRSRAEVDARVAVAGHSLGAAVALAYAAGHPARRVVLAAPFTSMVDMGHRVLIWPCGQLTWHRFDNREALDALAARPSPPRVLILHGDQDGLIPPAMGQELARRHPGLVDFRLVPGADHNQVVEALVDALAAE